MGGWNHLSGEELSKLPPAGGGRYGRADFCNNATSSCGRGAHFLPGRVFFCSSVGSIVRNLVGLCQGRTRSTAAGEGRGWIGRRRRRKRRKRVVAFLGRDFRCHCQPVAKELN